MFTKLCSLVGACAAVMTLAVVSGPATAPVSMVTAGSTSAVSAAVDSTLQATSGFVLPYEGHYLGVDTHHRTIRFQMRGGRIMHFFVNHTAFPDAHLQGHQWHHTCGNNLCTRGNWTTDVMVEGKWNDSRQGGDVHFTAQLVSH